MNSLHNRRFDLKTSGTVSCGQNNFATVTDDASSTDSNNKWKALTVQSFALIQYNRSGFVYFSFVIKTCVYCRECISACELFCFIVYLQSWFFIYLYYVSIFTRGRKQFTIFCFCCNCMTEISIKILNLISPLFPLTFLYWTRWKL